MKKKIIIGLIIVVIISIIGIILYSNDNIRFKFSYEYINNVEYNNGKKIKVSIPWDNKVKYLSEDEVLDLLEDGTGVLYFGYNSCPWCRNVIPTLIDVSKKNKVDKIYYVDIHEVKISKIKKKLFKKLDNYLREDDEGNKVLAVPDVYFVKKGKIVGHHLGTVDGYNNPYSGMNDKQKKELYNIYEELIKEMKK